MADEIDLAKHWAPRPPPTRYDVEPGYISHEGDQIYFVRHAPVGRRKGKVLLVGPFANERTCSMMTWRRWAERLAEAGLEVLRFDFRAIGESTGDFRKMSFQAWLDDARIAYEALAEDQGPPLILHGLRFGAIVVSHLFAEGMGTGLLMWDPPKSGRDMLMTTLRSRLAFDMAIFPDAPRVTRDEYVAQIEAGEYVNVEGFHWGETLWQSFADLTVTLPPEDEERPYWVVHLDGRGPERVLSPGRSDVIPIPRPQFWKVAPLLAPDLSDLFEASVRKISEWLEPPREGS